MERVNHLEELTDRNKKIKNLLINHSDVRKGRQVVLTEDYEIYLVLLMNKLKGELPYKQRPRALFYELFYKELRDDSFTCITFTNSEKKLYHCEFGRQKLYLYYSNGNSLREIAYINFKWKEYWTAFYKYNEIKISRQLRGRHEDILSTIMMYLVGERIAEIRSKTITERKDKPNKTYRNQKEKNTPSIEKRDSMWYTDINVEYQIPVKGHWRRQPIGPRGEGNYKMIWIESFNKNGYHRKAGIRLKSL